MNEEYDFSNAVKKSYAKKLKKQILQFSAISGLMALKKEFSNNKKNFQKNVDFSFLL